MFCYQDRTFCTAECAVDTCYRKLTDKVVDEALKWWREDIGQLNDNVPIAISDFSGDCDEYVEIDEV